MMVIYFCAIKFMFAKYLLFHDGNRQKSEKKVKNKRGFFVIRIQRKKLRFHFVYPQGLRFFSRVRLSHYVGLSVGLSVGLPVCLSVGPSHFTFGPQIRESKEEEEPERQWKPMGEG